MAFLPDITTVWLVVAHNPEEFDEDALPVDAYEKKNPKSDSFHPKQPKAKQAIVKKSPRPSDRRTTPGKNFIHLTQTGNHAESFSDPYLDRWGCAHVNATLAIHVRRRLPSHLFRSRSKREFDQMKRAHRNREHDEKRKGVTNKSFR